jgi:hypothetical protein
LHRDANFDVMEISVGMDAPPYIILGYLALETLDLYVDPKGQKLTGNPATDGKMYIDLFSCLFCIRGVNPKDIVNL